MAFAYWRKCDFQLHTPRDPGWTGLRPVGVGDTLETGSASRSDVEQQREVWADTFVEACVKRGLGAVAVTDHHEMVMVPYVQRAVARRKAQDADFDLWVFPGMELTAHGGAQCLILFDADLPAEWWKEAQTSLGIVVAEIDEEARQSRAVTQLKYSYPDLTDQLNHIAALQGRYILLPNVSQGGHHTVLKDGAHADFKRMRYVGAYVDVDQSIKTLSSKNLKRLSGDDPKWGDRFIYPLPTSDSRSSDFASLGRNNCWIKLAAPTAEAIRQAFLGYPSRISIEAPTIPNLRVQSLEIGGSMILRDATIELSPELNSFIGGRGSGKSTYLEYIAFGLGRSCYDYSKAHYSGSDRMVGLIQDTLINEGGRITLCVVQDGAEFRIQRSNGNAYEPSVTYPDGSVQELSPKDLRSLFPAVVYSQGELAEIGKQAGKRAQLSDLLQFVNPEFKRDDDRLSSAIETARLSVRSALQALVGAWSDQAKLHKLSTSKSALEQRLLALRKTLPALSPEDQATLSRYDALAAFDAKRLQAEKQVATVMESLADIWRTAAQPVDLTSDLPESAELQRIYSHFNQSFRDGTDALGKKLAEIRAALATEGTQLSTVVEQAKAARDKALAKLVEHRSVTQQISNLQSELQALLEQIGDIALEASSPDEKADELHRALGELRDAVDRRAAATREWAAQIVELSGKHIQAKLNVDGDWSEIREAVDVIAARTNSQEAVRQKQVTEQIGQSNAWDYIASVRSDALAALRWKLVGSSLGGERPPCPTLFATMGGTERTQSSCFELIDLPRVESISTATPKPDITLFYSDGDRRISFEKASEGQRAAALLFMLLQQPGGPLIVDQPEGDLDNKVISSLSERLHEAKQRRQIIFASHNANLVVNGSSELVACMDLAEDGKRALKCCGAIDQTDVCDTITETMEGGEKAFRDRKNKYGY